MAKPKPDENAIEEAFKALEEAKARKAAKQAAIEAERKAFWDEYYEQLKKATPFEEGGARRRRVRVFRLW